MMGHKQKLTPEGWDAVSGWRHVLCYLQRPGVRAGIKKRLRRAERRQVRDSIRKGEA